MKSMLIDWQGKAGWRAHGDLKGDGPNLVIYFGSKKALDESNSYDYLKRTFPKAHFLGCTTGGEILNEAVWDDTVVAAVIQLEKTTIRTVKLKADHPEGSTHVGRELAAALNAPDLSNIFLLSDGLCVNGSDLVRGIFEVVDQKVIVTGGLAGDGANFAQTFVGLDGAVESNVIAAIGFYGDKIKIGYGSVGGWDPFGPDRIITKSKNNVLYELDGEPALDLYKSYLGEEAKGLPATGLLFPLSIRPNEEHKHELVRTILSIDEDEKSMTFAGDIPEGYIATLMRGNFDNLVEGAATAVGHATPMADMPWQLAILISCIGRKLLLGQRISDETEAVAHVLDRKVPTIGFYSYGEICHQKFTQKCDLHNQTMTVTLITET